MRWMLTAALIAAFLISGCASEVKKVTCFDGSKAESPDKCPKARLTGKLLGYDYTMDYEPDSVKAVGWQVKDLKIYTLSKGSNHLTLIDTPLIYVDKLTKDLNIEPTDYFHTDIQYVYDSNSKADGLNDPNTCWISWTKESDKRFMCVTIRRMNNEQEYRALVGRLLEMYPAREKFRASHWANDIPHRKRPWGQRNKPKRAGK